MAYGLVLTFIGWHEEGGELVVKGKVRKFLQDNWIWNIFSSLYCQIAKGPYARRLEVELNFFFLWLVGLCYVPSHFYLKLRSHPQICATDDTQFTTHFFLEGFLKIFFSWLLKNVMGGTESLASVWGLPLNPLRADSGVSGRLLILSSKETVASPLSLVASSKQCCFIQLLRLLIMKQWLC